MRKVFLLPVIILVGCSTSHKQIHFTAKNPLAFERTEIITIQAQHLDSIRTSDWKVLDEKGRPLSQQYIDLNGDSIPDELIFQATFAANQERAFTFSQTDATAEPVTDRTFGRIVPERIDDFAWENDLVAFRTYGPEAQRLVDQNEKGGTLSSGMDCWLKRVHYPVINKWYKKYVDGGSYHKDDGEGYDPYHVGASRGCGGIGVWVDDSLFVSKNFTSYKTIANGPLRTVFELDYAPWIADGKTVDERKRISIDRGSQFSKITVWLGNKDVPNCTVGITLHDKAGSVQADNAKGWFRYWETIDDSELGTAVVIDPAYIKNYKDYRTTKKDLSHIYIVTQPTNESVTYYAGFTWKKAGIITSAPAWDNHLKDFSQRIANPITPVFEK